MYRNRKILDSVIKIQASPQSVIEYLKDITNIAEWDSEVEDVDFLKENEYVLLKKQGDLNRIEYLTVEERGNNEIIYFSKHGNVEYKITWIIITDNKWAKLKQELVIENGTYYSFSKEIKPIMRNKYKKILKEIKNFCELNQGKHHMHMGWKTGRHN